MAEVDEHGVSCMRQHDVARQDPEVRDVALVQVAQGEGELVRYEQGLRERHASGPRPTEQLGEGRAALVLEDQGRRVCDDVEAAADVRVCET